MGSGWRSSTPIIYPVTITSIVGWIMWIIGGKIILVFRRFVTQNGGLHNNLLSFALLLRPTPFTPGPVGGRQYLSLNLNFAGNYPWEYWKTTWVLRVWVSTLLFDVRSGLEGLVAWCISLWVVLRTPECGIRGIMDGPKRRQNIWKLSVLPSKRRPEPIATAIVRFQCAHTVMGYIFLTVVTQTREL